MYNYMLQDCWTFMRVSSQV